MLFSSNAAIFTVGGTIISYESTKSNTRVCHSCEKKMELNATRISYVPEQCWFLKQFMQ